MRLPGGDERPRVRGWLQRALCSLARLRAGGRVGRGVTFCTPMLEALSHEWQKSPRAAAPSTSVLVQYAPW